MVLYARLKTKIKYFIHKYFRRTLLYEDFPFSSLNILKSLDLRLLWESVAQSGERTGMWKRGRGGSTSLLQRGETMALASLVLRAYWCRSDVRGVRCQSQSEWTSKEYRTDDRQKQPFKRVTAQWSESHLRIQGELPNWGVMFDCLVKAWGSQPQVPNGNIFYVQLCILQCF